MNAFTGQFAAAAMKQSSPDASVVAPMIIVVAQKFAGK